MFENSCKEVISRTDSLKVCAVICTFFMWYSIIHRVGDIVLIQRRKINILICCIRQRNLPTISVVQEILELLV